MSETATVDKALFAFLNGLAKRVYFKETEFSDEFLRNDVLGGINEEGYNNYYALVNHIESYYVVLLCHLHSSFCTVYRHAHKV